MTNFERWKRKLQITDLLDTEMGTNPERCDVIFPCEEGFCPAYEYCTTVEPEKPAKGRRENCGNYFKSWASLAHPTSSQVFPP